MPESLSIKTHHPDETRRVGLRLASYLKPGDILGFEGPLGAGKTTLIQGLCQGLHITEKVVSPTFVLMHLYESKIPVYHFDLYRLEPKDFEDLGWDEYLNGKGISFLEWIDRAESDFPFPYLRVSIQYGDTPDSRTLTFTPVGMTFPWLSEFISRGHFRKCPPDAEVSPK